MFKNLIYKKDNILWMSETADCIYMQFGISNEFFNDFVWCYNKDNKEIYSLLYTLYLTRISKDAKLIYKKSFDKVIKHHGIKGQSWGVTNGPPYPLSRTSNAKTSNAKTSNAKTSNAKTSGSTPRVSKTSYKDMKNYLDSINADENTRSAYKEAIEFRESEYKTQRGGSTNNILSISDIYKNNPSEAVKNICLDFDWLNGNNCASCSLAFSLRMMGYDVYAYSTSSTGYYSQEMDAIFYDNFDGVESLSEEELKLFYESLDDAEKLLLEKFGDNSFGIITVSWLDSLGGGGHAYNWVIENGSLCFYDAQAYAIYDDLYNELIELGVSESEVNHQEVIDESVGSDLYRDIIDVNSTIECGNNVYCLSNATVKEDNALYEDVLLEKRKKN